MIFARGDEKAAAFSLAAILEKNAAFGRASTLAAKGGNPVLFVIGLQKFLACKRHSMGIKASKPPARKGFIMLRLIACYFLGSVLFFLLRAYLFAFSELATVLLLYAYVCVTFTFFCVQAEATDKKKLSLWAVLVPLTPLWVMWLMSWIMSLCDNSL